MLGQDRAALGQRIVQSWGDSGTVWPNLGKLRELLARFGSPNSVVIGPVLPDSPNRHRNPAIIVRIRPKSAGSRPKSHRIHRFRPRWAGFTPELAKLSRDRSTQRQDWPNSPEHGGNQHRRISAKVVAELGSGSSMSSQASIDAGPDQTVGPRDGARSLSFRLAIGRRPRRAARHA